MKNFLFGILVTTVFVGTSIVIIVASSFPPPAAATAAVIVAMRSRAKL
jgi:hypothetical protein|tara:strand:+ start:912 stop:1055 length:144 start_codon:yes stop_codon:yes gene_type:complete